MSEYKPLTKGYTMKFIMMLAMLLIACGRTPKRVDSTTSIEVKGYYNVSDDELIEAQFFCTRFAVRAPSDVIIPDQTSYCFHTPEACVEQLDQQVLHLVENTADDDWVLDYWCEAHQAAYCFHGDVYERCYGSQDTCDTYLKEASSKEWNKDRWSKCELRWGNEKKERRR